MRNIALKSLHKGRRQRRPSPNRAVCPSIRRRRRPSPRPPQHRRRRPPPLANQSPPPRRNPSPLPLLLRLRRSPQLQHPLRRQLPFQPLPPPNPIERQCLLQRPCPSERQPATPPWTMTPTSSNNGGRWRLPSRRRIVPNFSRG